jgi:prevent-host-death family protein
MQTISIRDLKNNPSNMTKHLESGEPVFVTKRGKPIGITLPLNDEVFSVGVKKAVAIELYKMGVVSLGKLAELLDLKKQEVMGLLNSVDVAWLEEDTQVIKQDVENWL